jgi:hypothetical protein
VGPSTSPDSVAKIKPIPWPQHYIDLAVICTLILKAQWELYVPLVLTISAFCVYGSCTIIVNSYCKFLNSINKLTL